MARVNVLLYNRRLLPGESLHRPAISLLKHRVVVVDDSPTYLAYVEQELNHDGYALATFAGGEAAIAHLNREGCDCILVDLVMPGIDGIELCRRLDHSRDRTGSWFPVLMVTGQDAKEDMMRARG